MKILSIVGTRPQFLKLAPLCKHFQDTNIEHIIIHTGQHYDKEMSDDIFKILEIPEPNYLLDKKGNTHAEITGNMMIEIEKILLDVKPERIIVYGDCDTTIAGALVAKKIEIFLIHIESGMRSYNKNMPEEINRVMTDHISDMLLCSTSDSVENLKRENITENVHFVGNLQLDLLKMTIDKYNCKDILVTNKLQENEFVLMTIHRHYNTNKNTLTKIFLELEKHGITILFPIHPRTRNIINRENIKIPDNIKLINPVNYLDMTILERYCKYIITDSGGVQPEAWYLGKKCIVMRSETEWIEPLENRNNVLYNYETSLNDFINDFLEKPIGKINFNHNISKNIIDIINI
jgi:UDP-GlcNAc3NAcA epimerase